MRSARTAVWCNMLVSGSFGTYPHGYVQCNLKGRGPWKLKLLWNIRPSSRGGCKYPLISHATAVSSQLSRNCHGDKTCPVRSVGRSNSLTAAWHEWWLSTSSQPDTSTDSVDVTSLTWEPGLKATVLARSDLAVEMPLLHLTSSGHGHNFRSSTCTNTIGFFGSRWMPTVWRWPDERLD